MDLSSLTLAELRDLQQQIPAELKRREVQEKANILNEVRAFAKARGFALEELVGKEVKIKVPTGKVKVKYRHPENASLEWTGRGRQPKWVAEWLAKGSSLDSLAV
ncbi:MAG: H-NS histone family protein [Dechloromonas sp.]|nr:MAG: H-NS histone family protein [Dechloromonas sp.]